MKKIAWLIAAISIIALTMMAVFAREQRVWRIVSIVLGLCAVVSISLRRKWTHQEEDAERRELKTKKQAEEKERHRLYALLHRVLAEIREHETRRPSQDRNSVIKAADKADSIIDWLVDTDPTDQQISSLWEKADLSPERDRAFKELEGELLQALRARM
jgi:Ca2+/Na+ antiporter